MDPEPTPPVTDDLQRLAAWHARRTGEPVAVVLGDDGVCAFAENRLVVNGDDFDGLTDEVKMGMTFEPLPDPEPPEGIDRARMRAVPSAPRVGTLHLDGTSVPLDQMPAQLDLGDIVTSRAGAGTLAMAMQLREQGLRVGLDVYGDWCALPRTQSLEGRTSPSAQLDAYALPQNTGRSGLVRAWQLVEAHRLLGGSPVPQQIGIIDGGFWFDPVSGACLAASGAAPEFPGLVLQHDLVGGGPRAGGPNPDGDSYMWHGQGTAGIAVGPHGDSAGVAGAGGTVAMPFLFRTDLSARQVIQGVRLATAWGLDVLNMSFGITVTSFLGFNPFPEDDFNAMFQWAEDNGVVILAAAGNDGARLPDLDVRPATRTPGVITVGALAQNDSALAWSGSNYGVSVDLWAPGEQVWVGPDGLNQSLSRVTGTSCAAPLVAGAAAMVLAVATDVTGRRPTAPEVQAILGRTAWRGSPDPKVTAGLDAATAVWEALGGQFRRDSTEPNDSAETARPLVDAGGGRWVPSVTGPRALSAYGDKDWWLLDVRELSRVQVRLDAAGYWGRPTLVLRPDDPESLVTEEMTETADLSSWTIEAAVVPPGRYRIGVVGGRTVYDLVATVSSTTLAPDEWEPNDSLGTASRFSMRPYLTVGAAEEITHPMGSYDFTLHAGDVDYLHVRDVPVAVAGGQTPEVQVGMADATVTTEVLDRTGRVLRRTTSQYYAGRLRLEPGSCYVRVSSDRPTRYKLTLTMMADLTLPPLKIPVDVLPPWEQPSPLWLSGSAKHLVFTVKDASPVAGLEVRSSTPLMLEVLGDHGSPAVTGLPTARGVRIDTSGLPAGEHVLRVSRVAQVDEAATALEQAGEPPRRQPGVRFTVAPVAAGRFPG